MVMGRWMNGQSTRKVEFGSSRPAYKSWGFCHSLVIQSPGDWGLGSMDQAGSGTRQIGELWIP